MLLFLRFLRFVRPYRWRLAWALLLVFVVQGVSLPVPKIFGYLIDKITPFQDWSLARQNAERAGLLALLVYVCAVIAAITIIGALVSYVRTMSLTFVGQRVLFDVRGAIYRHLQGLSLRYYESRSTGQIMARVLYDVDAIQAVLSSVLVDILSNVITVAVVMVLLFISNAKLALISVSFLPLYVINFFMLRRQIRRAAAEVRDQYSEVYSTLHESLAGVKIVKSFVRERHEARRFTRELREQVQLQMRGARWNTLMGIGANLITGAANVVVLLIGGKMVLEAHHPSPHALTFGALTAFRTYQSMLFGPVIALVTINQTITWVLAAIERIMDTLDTVPEIKDAPAAKSPSRIEGRVEFREVDFAYEPGKNVLEDISFVAEPGTTVALVGPSGGGKSTLVNLIPRFYDPLNGAVLVDEIDLRDMRVSTLRRNIGMVLQETFLFSGTLRENIKYGKPDASDEEIIEAAIAANAHDFIMEFPDGYETEVGERGVRLSGGQRQRISIARAILRNPRLLILDEATSALDSESEHLIQMALAELMKGRTSFVIAHRLSTVMNADLILVIDEGRIVERGKHEELASKPGGLYAHLCEIQFKRAEDKLREYRERQAAEGKTK
jgi:ATP-binding cassette, subfamily B, bacterial MsbA